MTEPHADHREDQGPGNGHTSPIRSRYTHKATGASTNLTAELMGTVASSERGRAGGDPLPGEAGIGVDSVKGQ